MSETLTTKQLYERTDRKRLNEIQTKIATLFLENKVTTLEGYLALKEMSAWIENKVRVKEGENETERTDG